MSIQGVDYPWRHPGGAALNAAGKKFAIRYLSHDTTKTLMRPEADDLARHGVSMVLIYEDSAQRALDGRSAGVNDATSAIRMATGKMAGYTDLAMPADRPIFFAVDFDAQWHQVADYFEGAALTMGKQRVGVYAGLDIVTAARSAGYQWLWQTGAWSHGQWNPYAQLRQLIKTERINGVECDVDVAMTGDYGQWTPGGVRMEKPMTDAEMDKLSDIVVKKLLGTAITAGVPDTNHTESVAAVLSRIETMLHELLAK